MTTSDVPGALVPTHESPSAPATEAPGATPDAVHISLSARASTEAGTPMPPRRVGWGAAPPPLPRPVRHLIARWQQSRVAHAEARRGEAIWL